VAELKTKKTVASVDDFLAKVSPEKKRKDAIALCDLMKKATKLEPKMWGASMYVMPGIAHYDELLSKLGKHKTGKGCLYINTETPRPQRTPTGRALAGTEGGYPNGHPACQQSPRPMPLTRHLPEWRAHTGIQCGPSHGPAEIK
jgi:hypothetical protein